MRKSVLFLLCSLNLADKRKQGELKSDEIAVADIARGPLSCRQTELAAVLDSLEQW